MTVAAIFLPLLGAVHRRLLRPLDRRPRRAARHLRWRWRSRRCWACALFVDVALDGHGRTVDLLTWIDAGDRSQVEWALRLDTLSAVMVAMVTGRLVRWSTSIPSATWRTTSRSRASWPICQLFTFFMLMLVTANNFVQLFFGWEGVGLCSYLLIGFWYDRPAANAAAIKAFVVNRVGDFGFALGIFAVYRDLRLARVRHRLRRGARRGAQHHQLPRPRTSTR